MRYRSRFKTPLATLYTHLFYSDLKWKYRDAPITEKVKRSAFKANLTKFTRGDRVYSHHVIAAIEAMNEAVPEVDK